MGFPTQETPEEEEYEVGSTSKRPRKLGAKIGKKRDDRTRRDKKDRRIEKPKNDHPIKNFLVAFRGFIMKYLKERMDPGYLFSIKSVQTLTAGATVSKQMFQDLFS